jgi:hypothetical protein
MEERMKKGISMISNDLRRINKIGKNIELNWERAWISNDASISEVIRGYPEDKEQQVEMENQIMEQESCGKMIRT